jgi:mannose-6-phosphate isomerase-like protein (cupin superfamily)
MVNKIAHSDPYPPFTVIQGGHSAPPAHDIPSGLSPSADRYDVLVDSRSRILVRNLEPDQSDSTVCHIHACKQITILGGYAEVELPDTRLKLFEGQSAHIPSGTCHRIVNHGKIPLKYVEIRTGPYVMDDDLLG